MTTTTTTTTTTTATTTTNNNKHNKMMMMTTTTTTTTTTTATTTRDDNDDDDDDDDVEQVARTWDGRIKRRRRNHADNISKMSTQQPLHADATCAMSFLQTENLAAKSHY